MKFSRSALAIVGIAMVAGGAYGYWQGRHAPQTANVSGAVAPASIAGTWTSADDPAYQVVFRTDGTLRELYRGETVSDGSYRFAETPEGYADGAYEKLGPQGYLLEDVDGERYAYRVISLTASSLELSYLERGNTLSFTR